MSAFAILLALFVGTFALIFVVLWILRVKPQKIFGIYPKREGILFYLKYYLALQALEFYSTKFKQIRTKFQNDLHNIDVVQVLSDHPKAYDQLSFFGSNQLGHRFLVYMERRKKGVFFTAITLYIPGKGVYTTPHSPDMLQFSVDREKESNIFDCRGLTIICVEPNKKWNIKYDGDLVNHCTNETYKVTINATFASNWGYFNYNTDLTKYVLADSLARESWNDDFFHVIKNVEEITKNREHYEQIGYISGNVQIGESDAIELNLQGNRNHCYGTERFLETVHRYAYFILFLSDGSSVVVGNLSQPSFFLSSLKVGYVLTKDGQYSPIKSSSFELYSYGEKGTPPKHKNFHIETEHESYLVSIDSESDAERFFGYDWEIKLNNQFVSCKVNGIPGYGFTEYLYRNTSGRPAAVQEKDPLWFHNVRSFERTFSNPNRSDENDQSEDEC